MSDLREPSLYRYIWPIVRNLQHTEVFCETGTGRDPGCGLLLGQMLELALYSCDINQEFVDKANARFKIDTVSREGSTSFLRRICPELCERRTLFFLDAHFPDKAEYENSSSTVANWPLIDELRIIRDRKANVKHDVILCDDINVIADPENPMYKESNSPDAQRAHPWRDYIEVFAQTHMTQVWPHFEGLLAFIPKEFPVFTT